MLSTYIIFRTQSTMNSTPDEGHLNQVEEGKDEIIGYAMQLALGSGLDAKLSASDIAAKISTQNPDASLMLDRILRLLASHQVLGCTSVDGLTRFYSLTPVAKYFVQGGIPFNRTYEMDVFEYPALDPRFNQLFNNAMFNTTTLVAKSILESYKGFEHLKQLVDVGGGLGHTIHAITSKYPHIKGINFGFPHVLIEALTNSGMIIYMFQSVPNGDAIFMKWILRCWSDDQCLKLLQNCYKAIPENGRVIVVEGILPAMAETSATNKFITQMDVQMMTQSPGGKKRTKQVFLALANGAGFSGIDFKCFVCNY
ncbi:hypothetical protein K2173_003422 [Erythroxylum novogranatense]|uniref:O-methyltransferase C-terminal domain-containing protein n=1 Tax=Erythroxylum novogranatense TaxID=1862640 RepID=A0AAV8S907_9ROSI|nr:hypothetical protein K2173_003422 [Erythroxylum novogranatense]